MLDNKGFIQSKSTDCGSQNILVESVSLEDKQHLVNKNKNLVIY